MANDSNNINDDNSNVKRHDQQSGGTTISSKRRSGGDFSTAKSSRHSKTFEIEIKKKKTSGLRVNLTAQHIKEETGHVSDTDQLHALQTGKLTEQELQTRAKALQERMKEEADHVSSIDEQEEVVSPIQDEPIVNNDLQNEQPIAQESKSRFQPSKKRAVTTTEGAPVVFKANEYIKSEKPVAAPKQQTEKLAPAYERFSKSPAVDTQNRKKKDDEALKNGAKKGVVDFSKKVSRAVLHRALDADGIGERTRSIASIRRAKQKIKTTSSDQEVVRIVRDVSIPDVITVSELANRMAVRGSEVVKFLIKIGTMATINQLIDGDTAEIVCAEFGHNPKRISESDIESEIENIEDDPKDLVPRAPIVAIMGHVDHGKTTILDTLRRTSVAAKEAGGITQHVSSYQVESRGGKKVTFIDTPGHAAFSKIRARGAVITDIVVLVVAADDGVKEQTIEAISHAKSQSVPMVVAINKIDKPNANIDKIKAGLMTHDVVLEEFGGDVLHAEISALKNINLDGLIDTILLQAEIMQLQANPNRKAVGTVLESRIAKGRGIVASTIIQHGTLKVGDIFVAGGSYGKVRMMFDDSGKQIKEAGPSMPVEVFGFNNAPEPGDVISVMDSEQKAREVAEYRRRAMKEKSSGELVVTMDQLMAGRKADKFDLNILAKADVYGSLEALTLSIKTLCHDEIEIKITESGVGMINESDVDFAKHTGSIIIGFNVGITADAKDSAKLHGVRFFSNSIIYHIIEEVKKEMSKLLPPVIEENYIGTADVRKIFSISRYGTIAGCYVIDGIVKRVDSKIKVMRNGICTFEGKIKSMKHEKDEIKESRQSHECGILADGYNDFQIGDKIECYEIVSKERFVE